MNKEEIQARIDEILADERLSYKTATVYVNAPLALIQISLEVELQTLDYITSQEFLETFGGNNCEFLNLKLSKITPELIEIGETLTNYEEKNIFSGDSYKLLKSKYFLLEIRAYTLYTKLKKECNLDEDLILYFLAFIFMKLTSNCGFWHNAFLILLLLTQSKNFSSICF